MHSILYGGAHLLRMACAGDERPDNENIRMISIITNHLPLFISNTSIVVSTHSLTYVLSAPSALVYSIFPAVHDRCYVMQKHFSRFSISCTYIRNFQNSLWKFDVVCVVQGWFFLLSCWYLQIFYAQPRLKCFSGHFWIRKRVFMSLWSHSNYTWYDQELQQVTLSNIFFLFSLHLWSPAWHEAKNVCTMLWKSRLLAVIKLCQFDFHTCLNNAFYKMTKLKISFWNLGRIFSTKVSLLIHYLPLTKVYLSSLKSSWILRKCIDMHACADVFPNIFPSWSTHTWL